MSHTHGTYKAYAIHGCRCDRCREYQNARVAKSRADRLASGRINHGSAGWDDGCRCDVCTTNHRTRYADYYERMTR